MKLTLEGASKPNLIRSYSAQEIRVGEQIIRQSCVITADTLLIEWAPATLAEIAPADVQRILELRPELVLIGTGSRQQFPPAEVKGAFTARGIGVESMDLGAACRTFNVLVQEERRVAAALFLK